MQNLSVSQSTFNSVVAEKITSLSYYRMYVEITRCYFILCLLFAYYLLLL